jgi:hypothetical protein
MMKTVQIPASLHEVLGKESTVAELIMIGLSSAGTSLLLFWATHAEWETLAVWKIILLFLLMLDIMAGFVANLTYSTNDHYKKTPTLRLIFIAIHIQPLVFAALLGGYFYICLFVWLFTIVAAWIVNALNRHAAQKPLAGSLVAAGLTGLFIHAHGMPILLLASLCFYQLKVIFSFAVDQYSSRDI